MRATLARLPGRSDAAAAIRYALARGDGLTRYLYSSVSDRDRAAGLDGTPS